MKFQNRVKALLLYYFCARVIKERHMYNMDISIYPFMFIIQ